MKKPSYGSYIHRSLIVVPAVLCAATLLATIWIGGLTLRIILWTAAYVLFWFSLIMAYFAYTYRDEVKLASRDALLDLLPWDGRGRALDIGTGSGLLAVGLGVRFPEAHIVGTDLWKWISGSDLGREQAVANAAAEGVAGRVTFEEADARSLSFEDDTFDAVVTNLVWHNIRTEDRFDLIREGLRVLKPGGAFMFADLFRSRLAYGSYDELTKRMSSEVSSLGIRKEPEIEGYPKTLYTRIQFSAFYGRK